MLSICIPIYNQNCQELVRELHQQSTSCSMPFEIIAIDDASTDKFKHTNRSLAELPFVQYRELPTNISRSAIRNLLGETAVYPYLLFLDCDIKINDSDYIKKYQDSILKKKMVIVGGRGYEKESNDRRKQLHFSYGSAREVISAAKRIKKPYEAFVTGNFVIQKELFQQIKFSATLTEYGHEDSLFGIELKKRNIPIYHIDNPVIHVGLEDNAIFLTKQFTALQNLVLLIQNNNDMSSISIYRFYKKIKMAGFLPIFLFCFGMLHKTIVKTLAKGYTSSLFLFDLVRLYEFSMFMKNAKR